MENQNEETPSTLEFIDTPSPMSQDSGIDIAQWSDFENWAPTISPFEFQPPSSVETITPETIEEQNANFPPQSLTIEEVWAMHSNGLLDQLTMVKQQLSENQEGLAEALSNQQATINTLSDLRIDRVITQEEIMIQILETHCQSLNQNLTMFEKELLQNRQMLNNATERQEYFMKTIQFQHHIIVLQNQTLQKLQGEVASLELVRENRATSP